MKTETLEKARDKTVLSAEDRLRMMETLFKDQLDRGGCVSFEHRAPILLSYAQEINRAICDLHPHTRSSNDDLAILYAQKACELLSLLPTMVRGNMWAEEVNHLLKHLWGNIFSGWRVAKVGSEQFIELSESLLGLADHFCGDKDVLGTVAREAFRQTGLRDDSRQRLVALCALADGRENVNGQVLAAAARAFVHDAIENRSFRGQPSILAHSFALVAEAVGGSGNINPAILPACRNFIAECAKLADLFSPLHHNHFSHRERNMDHGYWCECRGWKVVSPECVEFSLVYWPVKAESEAQVFIDTTIGVDIAKLKKASPVAKKCQVKVVCDIMPAGLSEVDSAAKPSKTIERIF